MSCTKRIKKFLAMIIAMVMMLSLMGFSSTAASNEVSNEGTAHELYYITYNEKNEIVEEGIIPVNQNARYSWSGSITLQNGWWTAFRKSDNNAFYVTNGTNMRFSFKLNRSAKITYCYYQDSVPSTLYPTEWQKATILAGSSTVSRTANKTAYYFVGITNASSDSITISNVSFVF